MLDRREDDNRSHEMGRRDFLRTSSFAAVAALPLSGLRPASRPKAVIQLCLVGGPSHLDTWDPKPDAPESIRGPFQAIATKVPGISLSECFPKMARIADKFSLLRTMHHNEAPIHETGQQLLQTGFVFKQDQEFSHFGAVAAAILGSAPTIPGWVGLPGPIGNTGVALSHGQSAAGLGSDFEPIWLGDRGSRSSAAAAQLADMAKQEADRGFVAEYGQNPFGQSCLAARRLVESGVRVVTVNMFETVFGQPSWDMHANGGNLAVNMDQYRNRICPMFDAAYTALLLDLQSRGMLDDVAVIATGEFGRTPKINPRGGRDHWAGAWTALVAGGGIQGGRLVGATDDIGAYPRVRPVTAGELVSTIYHTLGIDRSRLLSVGDASLAALPEPIHELF